MVVEETSLSSANRSSKTFPLRANEFVCLELGSRTSAEQEAVIAKTAVRSLEIEKGVCFELCRVFRFATPQSL